MTPEELAAIERQKQEEARKRQLFSPYKTFSPVTTTETMKASGVGIRFGNELEKDCYGDFFTPETETGLRDGSDRPFLMEHWEDKIFAWEIVGYAVYKKSEIGWEYDAEFLDNEFGRLAYDRISNTEHQSSTGSAWNYTRGDWIFSSNGDSQRLKTWLVIEQTATIKAADRWNPPIQVKSMADYKNLSALLAPILQEWQGNLLKQAEIETIYESVKSDIEQIKKQIKSFEPRGIKLSPEVEENIKRLCDLATFR